MERVTFVASMRTLGTAAVFRVLGPIAAGYMVRGVRLAILASTSNIGTCQATLSGSSEAGAAGFAVGMPLMRGDLHPGITLQEVPVLRVRFFSLSPVVLDFPLGVLVRDGSAFVHCVVSPLTTIEIQWIWTIWAERD